MDNNTDFLRCEQVLFWAISSFPTQHKDVVNEAVMLSKSYSGDVVSHAQVSDCLATFFERGLVQIVDSKLLEEIHNSLKRQCCHGPVLGMSKIGGLEFTPLGAELYLKKLERNQKDGSCSIIVRRDEGFVFSNYDTALDVVSSYDRLNLTPVSGPVSIGSWQPVPWLRLDTGYLVEFAEHYHFLTDASRYRDLKKSHERLEVLGGYLDSIVRKMFLNESEGDFCWVENASLAAMSGLFGYPCTSHNTLRNFIERQSQQLCEETLAVDAIINQLFEKKWIAVATDEDRVEFRLAMDKSKFMCSYSPTPRRSLILTPSGIQQLQNSLDLKIGTRGWRDLIAGEWKSYEYRIDYFDSLDRANEERSDCLRKKSHIVGAIEKIGRWCPRWWDIREAGYRFRKYDNIS